MEIDATYNRSLVFKYLDISMKDAQIRINQHGTLETVLEIGRFVATIPEFPYLLGCSR
jgi:hypothetical protein